MPFGIYIAPSYFTMMIKEMLKELDSCLDYLDDIIIYSKSERRIHRPPSTSVFLPIQSKHKVKADQM